jgi:tRNA pseudouridine38-40 synthase
MRAFLLIVLAGWLAPAVAAWDTGIPPVLSQTGARAVELTEGQRLMQGLIQGREYKPGSPLGSVNVESTHSGAGPLGERWPRRADRQAVVVAGHDVGRLETLLTLPHRELDALARALNAQLPEDVRVVAVDEAAAAFHARFDARSKTYRYLIRNDAVASPFERAFVWHVPQPLDAGAMLEAAARLVGRHDFAAFRSAGTEVPDSVRTLTVSAVSRTSAGAPWLGDTAPLLSYEVTGDGFLRHMVRAIVGTLVEVGRGWRDPAGIEALLLGRDRHAAGATAPPHGLFLVRVEYD